jgi:putative ABC transport system substrate-binding protein
MRRRQFITGLSMATLWSVAVRAQQPATPVIGYLSGWSPGDAPDYLAYFRHGPAEAGYTEGRNVDRIPLCRGAF